MHLTDFYNRTILLASKHQKERVIAPILEKEFQQTLVVAKDFDSDQFGTFCGTVLRDKSALETIKLKAKMALAQSSHDLVMASEGSFGPHPTIFFAPCNEEFLYVYDQKNGFEVTVSLISTETNYLIKELNSEHDFKQYLEQVQFPSHAIILKDIDTNNWYKGITNYEKAIELFNELLQKNGKVNCETDMRAMFNPTRMKNIEELTHKLVKTIQTCCPECLTPAFQVTSIKKGLPCKSCLSPTSSTLAYISQCKICHYQKEELFPHHKKTEDPMYCDFCNP